MENDGVEHEDIEMKLLSTSLDEYPKNWFKGLPENHLQSYESITNLLSKIWTKKKDNEMLLMQFNQIKKKENEIVEEFDARFDHFLRKIQM